MLYKYIATSTIVLRNFSGHHLSGAYRAYGAAHVTPARTLRHRSRLGRDLSIMTGPNDNVDSAIAEAVGSTAESKSYIQNGDQGVVHVESFEGKMVPLGRGFTVRRILPFRKQRSVGPFVFLDHFGPVDISDHAMNVGPHPHIGIMTISYLFKGAILHRDSTGAEQIVLPGEVNGMIAGRGVTHSERGLLEDLEPHLRARKVPDPTGSHGLQLWMALSKDGEDVEPSFHHGIAVPINQHAALVVGQSNGLSQPSIPIDPELGKVFYVDTHFDSPNETYELEAPGGAAEDGRAIEVGVYVSSGKMEFSSGWGPLNGKTVDSGYMFTVKSSAAPMNAQIRSLETDTRVAIIGGTPLPEKRHMFWNFVSASKDKVNSASKAWEELDRNVFPEVVNESNEDSIPLPRPK